MLHTIHTADKRISWRELLLPWQIGSNLYRHTELIRQFIVRDVLGRYRGSYLGIFWSLLRPLCMLCVFSVVFGYIFNSRLGHDPQETRADFAMALFCGLIAFDFFAECLARAPSLVLANANYVTKVVFPLEILPVSAVIAALAHLALSLVPLLVAYFLWHGTLHLTVLWLPLLLLPLVLVALGVTWLFSSLGVFIRDINSFVPVIHIILMYASAIFYPIKSVPPQLLPIVKLNPLAVLIDQMRNVFMWGVPPDWKQVGPMLLVSTCMMIAGYAFFMRTKRAFADVI